MSKRRQYEVAQVDEAARPGSVDRFLGGMLDDVAADLLRATLATGYQLKAARVPDVMLPAVVLLAAYGLYAEGVDLVDDYTSLLEALRHAFAAHARCHHSDLHIASCVLLLAQRGMAPSTEAWAALRMPEVWAALVAIET